MSNNGWVYLHRKIIDWRWYKVSVVKDVFIHLLLTANHDVGYWQGVRIERGQLITGRKALAENIGISEQSIRTALSKLKSTNEITTKSTNKFSLITIVNYERYQLRATSKSTSSLTNNQPTTNQQPTTNNKENKNNKDNKERESTPTKLEIISFKSRRDITENILQEIATKFEVPVSFVADCWDSAQNWCDAKGKVMQDYKAFLSNWVKRERADFILKAKKYGTTNRVADYSNL